MNVNCINSRTTEVTCYSSQAEKQAEGETTYEYMIWPLGPLKHMQTMHTGYFFHTKNLYLNNAENVKAI